MNMALEKGMDLSLFLGLEETIGSAELSKLRPADPSDPIAAIRKKMDERYGKTGASGVAICSGRAAFKHLLEKDGIAIGFEDADFKFLPARLKVRKGLELLASWLEDVYALKISVRNSERELHVDVKDPQHPKSEPALCDFTSGLLQGFLAWTSGGKFFVVRETECRAAGAEQCSFSVGKFPLE
jgi:predicted hydrocarbon binding protein